MLGLSTATAKPADFARAIAVTMPPTCKPLVRHNDLLQTPGLDPTCGVEWESTVLECVNLILYNDY